MLYPLYKNKHPAKTDFVENQLFLSLISLSPLTITSPIIFQHKTVRPSISLKEKRSIYCLVMVKSLSFGFLFITFRYKKLAFTMHLTRYVIKLVGPLYKRYTGINSRDFHNTFHNYFISTDVFSPFLYSTFTLSDIFYILGFEGGSPLFQKRLTYSIVLI